MKGQEKIVNLEDFFTEENEEKGIWYEPIIKGKPCGMEFLITGSNTNRNAAQAEIFKKKRAEIEGNSKLDTEEKSEKLKELDSKRAAEFIKGIRPAEGCKINFDNKDIEYSNEMIEKIMFNAPLIRIEVINFAYQTENFMNRKK